jgi:hypothetical protein
LQQLGIDSADAVDAALYESMLLDAATVLHGRNPDAAVCVWNATDKYAVSKFQQLLDCSLVKVVSNQLLVLDVIKCISTRKALRENMQCMTRVWLPGQVIAASS